MRVVRALIFLVLVAAAAIAPGILWRDHAREAGEEAVRRVQTWRVAGTTASRIDAWLERQASTGEASASLQARPLGLFADEVEVELVAEGRLHVFAVDTDTGAVRPVDAAAQALVERIRAEAEALTK